MEDEKGTTNYFIDMASHKFVVPEKQIKNPMDLPRWENSQAYSELVGFILTLNEAIKKTKIRDEYHVAPLVEKIVGLLDQLDTWINDIPPVEQPQRFGNKAFRTWFSKLKQESSSSLEAILPEEYHAAVPEISTYLVEAVGNDTRIDYGTGHELSFVAFLCCLCKIGALSEKDYKAIVLKVFERYLYLVRKLQLTYRMEPAGSHGVWSLDDYQFLPFLWGSAQFIDNPRIHPKSFPEPDIYNSFYKDFMFLSAIRFINQVKTGPFSEHSNQLWNISGVPVWSKVNSGLIKMYKAEVLAKFPIVQHFLFGSLLTLEPAPAQSSRMPVPTAKPTTMPPPKLLATVTPLQQQQQSQMPTAPAQTPSASVAAASGSQNTSSVASAVESS